jgi:hypothetical protein
VALNGASLRARWALEVLAWQHCACFNAHLAGTAEPAQDSRACAHAARLMRLFDIGGEALGSVRHLLPKLAMAHIDALRAARRWDEALMQAEALVRRVPGDPAHTETLASLHFERAALGLRSGEDEVTHRFNAEWLRSTLIGFEQARLKHPFTVGFYRGLSRCQRMLAVCSANVGELADALVAIRWACKYDPNDEEAQRLQGELNQLVEQLRERVAELQKELARRAGAQLNEAGQGMVRNAETARQRVEQVDRSVLALALEGAFQSAIERDVWLQVGEPEPGDRWRERAHALHDALLSMATDPPQRPEGLESAWQARVAESELLRECHAEAVCGFLRKRLFGIEPASDAPAPVAQDPAIPPFVIKPARPSLEPMGLWAFSRRDMRAKLQALIVAALVFGALWLFVDDWQGRRAREHAYGALRTAVNAGNDVAVLDAAEAFLAVRMHSADSREADVRHLYGRAFARWFADEGRDKPSEAKLRAERYRAIAAEAGKGAA